jgi:hypothetical protein
MIFPKFETHGETARGYDAEDHPDFNPELGEIRNTSQFPTIHHLSDSKSPPRNLGGLFSHMRIYWKIIILIMGDRHISVG